MGRTFSRAADGTTNEPLVVLSHAAWTGQFASDPQTVNRRVRINGTSHTVVGVMPASFDYPEGAKAWVLSPKAVPLPPIDVTGDLLESRGVHYFQAVARLRPGVTPEQARADLAALADDQARRFPESNGGRGVAVQPLHEKIVGDVRGALFDAAGGGRRRAADRLRQCRQPAAGARVRTAAGDRDSGRARRRPRHG